MNYLLRRLSEASTWRGIVALITVTGVSLSAEQGQQIITVGLAVIGLIQTFMPDNVPAEKMDAVKAAVTKKVEELKNAPRS